MVLAAAAAVLAVGRQSDPAASPRRQAVGREEEAGRLTTTPVGPVDPEAVAEQSGAREGEEMVMVRVSDRTDAWGRMA